MLVFVAHKNIKFFQMDVKSVLLNGFIGEEVYFRKPPSFEYHRLLDHVFK